MNDNSVVSRRRGRGRSASEGGRGGVERAAVYTWPTRPGLPVRLLAVPTAGGRSGQPAHDAGGDPTIVPAATSLAPTAPALPRGKPQGLVPSRRCGHRALGPRGPGVLGIGCPLWPWGAGAVRHTITGRPSEQDEHGRPVDFRNHARLGRMYRLAPFTIAAGTTLLFS
jgi:hypothetical protein